MKYVILFFITHAIAFASLGQTPILIKPKIQDVTVYLSGAEVRFKEKVLLKRGDNMIHFTGLSPSMVQNSLHVTVGENIEVLSVSTEEEQLLPEEIDPRLKSMKDSITALEDQIVENTNRLDAYAMEKQTLAQNQHVGTAAGVQLTDLAKAADFFRERTLKINTAMALLNKNLKNLNDHLAVKKAVLDRRLRTINRTRYRVTVTVNSKTDQSGEFAVRYLVEDASWEASYDIVATEIGKPVTLKYKAQVYNTTGIDWENVTLSLSTGDISLDATRPYLTAWTLNYTSTANEGFLNTIAQNRAQSSSDSTVTEEERTVSELNTSFVMEQRHSIQANGQPYRIGIQTETLQASFEYITIPKMELSAFLMAKVTGWEKLNLIDGVANIYYGNSYIGESNINTRLIGDTLELSLGRDNQLVVSRSKVEDKGNTQTLGGKRSESFIYEIQLRNNRKVPVSIRVQDQLPVAQEKDISVEVSDSSGAALDAPSGRLQWIKNLNPGETSRYKIAFTVRYPKNKTVNIRKSRLVRTARYRR